MTKITHLHTKHPLHIASERLLIHMDETPPEERFKKARNGRKQAD